MNLLACAAMLVVATTVQAQRSSFHELASQLSNVKCEGEPADVVFVLDSSSSIWPPDFKRQLVFVKTFVLGFNVGPGPSETRVGVVTFDDNYHLQFHLKERLTKHEAVAAIENIENTQGNTNTGAVLSYMTDVMFTPQHGSRDDVAHIAIVITDGRSQEADKTTEAAKAAHKKGIQIFALGVGKGVSVEELESIASDPDSNYVIQVMNYRALEPILANLTKRACEAVPITKPTLPPTEAPVGCTKHQFECDNGECIDSHLECNDRSDCTDSSDEIGCAPVGCGANEFECTSGECIPKRLQCDGQGDCADYSDEQGCVSATCPEGQFMCLDEQECIDFGYTCDGYQHCRDGSDESPTTCGDHPSNIQGDSDKVFKACSGKPADVFFLIDSSSSIRLADYKKQKQFVENIVDINFDVGPDRTRVGVATFSDAYEPVIAFDDFLTKQQLIDAIDKLPYLAGGTNTGDGIKYARELGFSPSVSRREVAHVLIVLTDGISRDPYKTLREANITKNAGIYIFAIGIGIDYDKDELAGMASKPTHDFVFEVNSFGALQSIRNKLSIRACETSPEMQGDQGVCGSGKDTDILFVFDTNRVGFSNSRLILQFIHEVTNGLMSRSGHIRYGIMSSPCSTNLPIAGDSNQAKLELMINTGYGDLTALLKRVRTEGFESMNGGRSSSRQMVILFMDSEVDNLTLKEGGRLRFDPRHPTKSRDRFVVAIGNDVDRTQADTITGDRANSLQVSNYAQLPSLATKYIKFLCGVL